MLSSVARLALKSVGPEGLALMDGKSCVTGGDEDRFFIGKPSGSEVGRSLEVSQKSNCFDEVTLSWLSVVGAGHDDG